MATTYLAPGVYVEEVPSAAQPIAGVGTNTVGFIGIVKKSIQYPVPNEHYDEYLAQALFRGVQKDATDEEKKTAVAAQQNLDQLTGGGDAGAQARRNAEKALKDAQDELDKRKAEASAPPEGGTGTPPPAAPKKADLKPLEKRVADATDALAKLAQAVSNEDQFLKPYRLETFEVGPDVLETKLCTNFTEYMDRFGPYSADLPEFASHRALTHAVAGFFKNGGTRCFVVANRGRVGARGCAQQVRVDRRGRIARGARDHGTEQLGTPRHSLQQHGRQVRHPRLQRGGARSR